MGRVERDGYSQRMATMGSILAARNAGSSEAQLAIPSRTAAEATNTQGSCRGYLIQKACEEHGRQEVPATSPATHPTICDARVLFENQ